MRVLLIEDDSATAQSIELMLQSEGFNVYTTDLGEEGVDLGKLYDYDIILLDLNLPDMSGYEVLKTLRVSKVQTPILILSGLAGIEDKVRGLGFGADDYMTKPFGIEELLARITATLRRTRPIEPVEASPLRIEVGDLVIDLDMRLVTRGGEVVHLTPTEFALLRELAINRGKLLTHAQLLRRVWGPGYATETEYVRVYIRRLRAKLENGGGPPVIITQPRAGYRFVP
jgi:two-component system, cell cycle response regulator CtrA